LPRVYSWLAIGLMSLVVACSRVPDSNPEEEVLIGGIPASQIIAGYGLLADNGYTLPPIPPDYLWGVNRRSLVAYNGSESPGTIEIDPHAKFLYWVMEGGLAMRYPIAIGREGRSLSGSATINRKEEWPGWTPTANMLRNEPELYAQFSGGVPGGLTSPLGARALYLFRGGRDTFYRIHGTNDIGSIGNAGSAGCIRMFNHDVIDLFNRAPLGTQMVVRSYEESVRIEGPALANRGIELPAFYISSDDLENGRGSQRPPVPEAMINADGTYPPEVLALIARLEAEQFPEGTVLVPEADDSALGAGLTPRDAALQGDPLSAGTIGLGQ
jgi:lipoprotein-anchoring transpeptidase ErfK/SrfK